MAVLQKNENSIWEVISYSRTKVVEQSDIDNHKQEFRGDRTSIRGNSMRQQRWGVIWEEKNLKAEVR